MKIKSSAAELILNELANPPEWITRAPCGDIDVFRDRDALASLCESCPVFEECSQYSRTAVLKIGAKSDILYAGKTVKMIREEGK